MFLFELARVTSAVTVPICGIPTATSASTFDTLALRVVVSGRHQLGKIEGPAPLGATVFWH